MCRKKSPYSRRISKDNVGNISYFLKLFGVGFNAINSKLEQPLYTPSTKAADGLHDENIHPDRAAEIIGKEMNDKVT